MTVGMKIRDELHLIRTGWQDMDNGGSKFGLFDPNKENPAERYGCPVRAGNPNVTAIRGYLPENITGAHAPGLNSKAIEVVYRLWPDVTPSPHDLEDIDMVNGAATAIVLKAQAAGLLDAQGGDGPTDGDPCANVKAELAASEAERAVEIKRAEAADGKVATARAAASKARKAMPGKGGGIYRNILVELLGTLEGL